MSEEPSWADAEMSSDAELPDTQAAETAEAVEASWKESGDVIIQSAEHELSNAWPLDILLVHAPSGLSCRTAEALYWVEMLTYTGMTPAEHVLRAYVAAAKSPTEARYFAKGVPSRSYARSGKTLPRWIERVIHIRRDLARQNGGRLSMRSDGDNERYAVMSQVIAAKYTTSSRARDALMATGDRTLMVDLGPYERQWGCGSTIKPGLNMLGRLTQKWRDENRSD